ncbi:type IV pilus twitching motility protein PilT [Cerasicoccus arenae]|uniref:Twitching motility protein PilT n=1 Tax=Cerasicoccus arenae TaxID=424488 RepID=A0A8J3GC52_9BACT|nr:PilT/PilU family type 4a pilus ATPase [Cerasicoccus arenae]MBK1857555.1 PilT/PilU family type 4a pilus ATPase [Cerasicoccus arenae]GHB95714.1 twitching motility protein PilT [Cerasicoccus arenae]
MAEIDALLKGMLDNDGSDLHLAVGSVPKIRASGAMQPLTNEPVTAKQMAKLLSQITNETRWNHYLETRDLDLAYEIKGLARFRGSFFYNHWGQAAVFRQIPAEILSFDTLKLPEVLRDVCAYKEGLVFVTGPTGSGKSTTLAAMIDYINENYQKHIITIEDPIEFVHPKKKSVIVHREVGEHSGSFANALRGAMRADPDIILVGEMRELETIKLALGCASMGMLVFGTLHTNNAPKTVDRIIDAFPAEEQGQIRIMLAGCLSCVVSQLLCKKVPKGRVAVHEILLKHDALPNTIRSGRTSAIRGIIESSMAQGMTMMDFSIKKQLEAGNITGNEAYMKAADKEAFKQYLDDPVV